MAHCQLARPRWAEGARGADGLPGGIIGLADLLGMVWQYVRRG